MAHFLQLALLADDDFGLLLAAEHRKLKSTTVASKFDLKSYDESRCKYDFRFEKQDIFRLFRALHLPMWIKTKTGLLFKGLEGTSALNFALIY